MAKKSLNMIEKMMDPNIIDYYIINCAIPSIITIENRYQIDFGKPDILFTYRLLAEIDDVVGDKAFISEEDWTKLKYTAQVIKETLWFYTPVVMIKRYNMKETYVDGFRIPKGTEIAVSSTLLYFTMYFGKWWSRKTLYKLPVHITHYYPSSCPLGI